MRYFEENIIKKYAFSSLFCFEGTSEKEGKDEKGKARTIF